MVWVSKDQGVADVVDEWDDPMQETSSVTMGLDGSQGLIQLDNGGDIGHFWIIGRASAR